MERVAPHVEPAGYDIASIMWTIAVVSVGLSLHRVFPPLCVLYFLVTIPALYRTLHLRRRERALGTTPNWIGILKRFVSSCCEVVILYFLMGIGWVMMNALIFTFVAESAPAHLASMLATLVLGFRIAREFFAE